MLIGNPSTGKSQPLEMLKRAVTALEKDDLSKFTEAYRVWQTAAAVAKEVEQNWQTDVREAVKAGHVAPARPATADFPTEPLRPRIVVGNITVEKTGSALCSFSKRPAPVAGRGGGVVWQF